MEITAFDRGLDAAAALERSRNLSAARYLRHLLAETLGVGPGIGAADPDVYVVYYPDYIAYTTVSFRRLRSGDTMRFLAGVDAVTGRVGEIDVELPDRRTRDVAAERVIEPEVAEAEVEPAWQGWLFEYMSRNYRAMELTDYSLDEVELVYTPYWIIDNGTAEASLAVSDLTRRAAKVEEIEVIGEFYRRRATPD
jgi:hypothetical protein